MTERNTTTWPPGNYPQDPQAMNMLGMGMFGKDPITTTCPNCQANVSNLMLTRRSILGSDGMTKSDCSLSL